METESGETKVEEKAKESKDAQYRLNLGLNPEAKSELENLKILSGKESMVDVIRTALATLKLVVDLQHKGERVVFRNPDGTEEIIRFI